MQVMIGQILDQNNRQPDGSLDSWIKRIKEIKDINQELIVSLCDMLQYYY